MKLNSNAPRINRQNATSLQSIHDLAVALGSTCSAARGRHPPAKKFNPNHRPPGCPQGGQFCSPDQAGVGENPLMVPVRRIGKTPPEVRTPAQSNHDAPEKVRATIANTAAKHVGSMAWAYDAPDGTKGYKCNIFVADMLSEAGVPVGKLHDSWTHEYVPLAGEWADPNFEIPGWKVLPPGTKPEPGDIAAEYHFLEDLIGLDSGHVGIVMRGDGGKLGTASSSTLVARRERGKSRSAVSALVRTRQ